MKIETIYGLEWEYKALQETIDHFLKQWENSTDVLNRLTAINARIYASFIENGIKLVGLNLDFKDKDQVNLYETIINKLILSEPFLARLYFYISIPPKDIHPRMFLKKTNHVSELWIYPLYIHLENIDVLENSKLAKSILHKDKPIKSIPLSCFITGKILAFLFSEYDHYSMIDKVKQSGVSESIDELMKNRIYESAGETVYDYTPIVKKTLLDNGISYIMEVFDQETYDFLVKGTSEQFDEILCNFIQKPQPDPRPNIYFGDNPTVPDSYMIVRFGANEKKIPFRLLSKYNNLVMDIKDTYRLTNLTTDKKKKDTEDETQEAITGLYEGAITWDKNKGAVSSWLKQKTKWHLGDAFNKVSDDDPKTKKRILCEKIDSEGGSLDVPPDKPGGYGETKGTQLKDYRNEPVGEQVMHKEDLHRLNEKLDKDPKMKAIVEKVLKGKPLADAEQKYKERFKKRFKQ